MRLPTTTYGYTPPENARADGWRCFADDCHAGGGPAPKRWPAACPECGAPVDPTFEDPWEHDAEGVRLAYQARTGTRVEDREIAGANLLHWEYRDAVRGQDPVRQDAVATRFLDVIGQLPSRDDAWAFRMALTSTAWDAVGAADLPFAADLILAWRTFVPTDDVEDNNPNRAEARSFVSVCVRFLEHPESIEHAREAEVEEAMWTVVDLVRDILNPVHTEGFARIARIRATAAEVARIDRQDQDRINTIAFHLPLPHPRDKAWGISGRPPAPVRRELESATYDDLARHLHTGGPTTLWAAVLLTNTALLLADVHDDVARLFTTADLLTARQEPLSAALAHLLRAHGHIALMHDGDREQHAIAAREELEQAKRTPPLRPSACAVHGLLTVQRAQDDGVKNLHGAISDGVTLCREGRDGRRTSGADLALARLLVRRALLPDDDPAARQADAREAARLARRWRKPVSAQVILNEALRAQDALAGGTDTAKRAKGWRKAAEGAAYAPTAMRMRLAVAWVAWAVERDDPALACEAYEHLMALIPLDAAARYRPDARERVLGAAQEHTEEAGYWLARAGRYREAVLALETGRAIALSHRVGWDNADTTARLERAGQRGLVVEYRAALAALSSAERASTGAEGPDSPLRHAWAHARAVADRIAEATGQHPLASAIDYAEITRPNDDGAVIYLAAAKAAGYALVIAGGHDPQYIHLPRVGRQAVDARLAAMLPPESGAELYPAGLARGLQWLAESGLQQILFFHARGRIVTLIPVGLLSLLPLHAASDKRGNHIGDHSAIRYAPNVRTLLRCRDTARVLSARPLRLLAVNVPDGHGHPATRRLTTAAEETSAICRIWTSRGREGRVVDNCTWAEFRNAADDYPVWHIACHGSTSPYGTPVSTVHFADAAVTLDQFATELRAGPRRLAVLSACESHLTGKAVPNEVVGLPAALLQLGFSGVIATAWRVNSVAATYLMTHFYQSWSTGDTPPAVALNQAQTWLRNATREDLELLLPDVRPGGDGSAHPYAHPYYWAAFAYTGA